MKGERDPWISTKARRTIVFRERVGLPSRVECAPLFECVLPQEIDTSLLLRAPKQAWKAIFAQLARFRWGDNPPVHQARKKDFFQRSTIHSWERTPDS